MFDQRKKVGNHRLFFIAAFECKIFVKYYKPNSSQHPFTYYYLPKTYFLSFIGGKRIYFCIGFINNCDVTFCTPNAETFFISPWEGSLFCCFFSIPHNSQGLFFERRTQNTEHGTFSSPRQPTPNWKRKVENWLWAVSYGLWAVLPKASGSLLVARCVRDCSGILLERSGKR